MRRILKSFKLLKKIYIYTICLGKWNLNSNKMFWKGAYGFECRSVFDDQSRDPMVDDNRW